MPTLARLNWVFGCGGIVAYHDVTREPFSPAMHITVSRLTEQLEFLEAERYHLVSLSELLKRRRDRRSVRRCVALTFDDAYQGVLELALPVLQRFAAPATVFVATAYAQQDGDDTIGPRYWWDRLTWIRDHSQKGAAPPVLGGSPHEARAALVASSAGRLGRDAEAAIAAVEGVIGVVPERPMSEAELHGLVRSDLIELGCHTVSHPALPALPPDEQRREISSSYTWLAERFARVRPLLAYPYGLYDRTTMAVARDAGMQAAFSIEGRAAGPRFDMYACPRIGSAEVTSHRGFQLRLNWLAIPLVALRNRGWHPRMPDSRLAS